MVLEEMNNQMSLEEMNNQLQELAVQGGKIKIHKRLWGIATCVLVSVVSAGIMTIVNNPTAENVIVGGVTALLATIPTGKYFEKSWELEEVKKKLFNLAVEAEIQERADQQNSIVSDARPRQVKTPQTGNRR